MAGPGCHETALNLRKKRFANDFSRQQLHFHRVTLPTPIPTHVQTQDTTVIQSYVDPEAKIPSGYMKPK